MEQEEIKQAQERGFNRVTEYYKYRVDLKHQLRLKGINFNESLTLEELENLLKSSQEIKATNKDFFFNKIFIDNNIERLGLWNNN